MDFMQKVEALAALAEVSIKFREREWRIGGNEPWYVEQKGIDIRRGVISCGEFGNGHTPQEAIEDHWRRMTELKDDEFLTVRNGEARRHVRWNGFMWADVRIGEKTEPGCVTV